MIYILHRILAVTVHCILTIFIHMLRFQYELNMHRLLSETAVRLLSFCSIFVLRLIDYE